MEKERNIDKRKARDKETEDEAPSESSQVKNPTKRARVDMSTSPKEKSHHNLDQKHSPGKSPPLPLKTESNGGTSPSSGNSTHVISKKKFDLPGPYSPQELAQKIGNNNYGNEGGDSDEDSTKFLTEIIRNENKKAKMKANGSPVPKLKRNGGSSKSHTGENKGLITSSPNLEMSSQSLSASNPEVEVSIRVCYPNTGHVLLEETTFRSDFLRMDAFLKQHNLKICFSSQNSSSSGYLGDMSSSMEYSAGRVQGTRSDRWTISSTSSLGSTIPRESIVSIATEKSESPDERRKKFEKALPASRGRSRNEPLLTSTKIGEESEGSATEALLVNKVNNSSLSNGDSSYSSSGKSHAPVRSPAKKVKGTPTTTKDEGIGSLTGTPSQASTPAGSTPKRGPKSSLKTTPANSDAGKTAGRKRRVGSANNFPITIAETPAISAVLNTPPPARSVAKIEGTSAKPLTKFEQEMNDEPVVVSKLDLSGTLYTTILPSEPVFARWRDRNYYSGVVKSKGLNDTWLIDFDDGMEYVASESHIIPLRILGVGVKGIYSHDDNYEPRNAEIIGQKFVQDPDGHGMIVKYAIKYKEEEETKLIWCSRRQLVIKEADAKKLRPDVLPSTGVKPGDVSLDNIVSGPRRRTRGGESEGTSGAGNKAVASVADVSVTEDNSKPGSSTPKSRGGNKGTKKTPMSETKKKRPGNAGAAQTKDASTSSPVKESPEKETPSRSHKASFEVGKKKSRKVLFQNMQFFLTAAGGGDPGISGPQTALAPYDKDELRDQIESCGGEVLDLVGNENVGNCFLISDGYARTVKYIYSLACGIPCVSNNWLSRCLDMNEIVDWSVFLLPAGWSLEHQDVIPNHNEKPLKDFKIFVTSESDQLYNYWKPVLTAAEAILLKPPRKKGQLIPNGTEVVVTDNHSEATRPLLEEAELMSIPVVKPEWLVQTIIMGSKAHMYGHEKYRVLLEDLDSELDGLDPTDATENEEVEDDQPNPILGGMEIPD